MKIRHGLLLLILLSGGPLRAEPAASPTPSPRTFYLELGEGMDLPLNGWQSAYSLAPDFKFAAGYALDPHWAIQLDLSTALFFGINATGRISDQEVLVLPMIRYQFEGDPFRPYLLAGFGGEFELLSSPPSGATVADFDGALGAGVETTLYRGFSLFVEGKYNWIFSSKVAGQDLPLWVGVHGDMD